ncbi:MAG: type II toxin-antitoxin system Xre/ParS family antitoxin [Bacteroidales bacterium]|mgnify:CR=1 FL=1|nr:DUF2384 domain-containing protein [Bacteroidales bacterium]
MTIDKVLDPEVPYGYSLDDSNTLSLIQLARKGIAYQLFYRFARSVSLTMQEWSSFLHVSERTLQRYSKENRPFAPDQSEKILEIALLYKKGIAVFGSREKFDIWLTTKNIALGGIMPKTLLDSSLGIHLVNDELSRLEQGVLA